MPHDTAAAAPAWGRKLNAYKQPRTGRSLLELAITAVPLAAIWALAYTLWVQGFWWAALPLVVPAAGFLLRLFLIQHDCGHGAYFKSKAPNEWLGRVLGVLTLTPYDYWRRTHAIHHATSGDLDRRGLGAVELLTVEEYKALSPFRQALYRTYRHPAVMFGLGPMFLYFIQQRIPVGLMREGWRPWASTLGNSAGIALLTGGLMWLVGPWPVIVINGLSTLIAATVGVWLFYVQHQFEGVEWVRSHEWKPESGAFASSSHYVLPPVLQWFTANIGVHHVHHLSSRIPFYRLPEVLRDHPELRPMSLVRFRESLGYARLALWDEARKRLVAFRDIERAVPA